VLSSIVASALLLAACDPSDSGGASATNLSTVASANGSPPVPQGDPEELRANAAMLWQARVDENWTAAFEHEDTRAYPDLTVENFITWSTEQEPFRYKSFELGQVLVERDLGWVEVTSATAMRRFPKMPPRDTTRWEKWRLVEGMWKLLPREEIEDYPESPAVRDADAEAALAKRFAESWKARATKDWSGLYQLLDPEDRPDKPDQPPFLPLDFIEHDIHWIQATGDSGIVRVEILQKIDDPSLTKIQPNRVIKNERWVRRQGQWYLDLSNQE
jgi:hypothetical protein